MRFRDREDAAQQLSDALSEWRGKNPLVLGVPRGAVPMAKRIATALEGDLDVVLAHKVTLPENPEFAVGAVTEAGDILIGQIADEYGFSKERIRLAALEEIEFLKKKRILYTPYRSARDVRDRQVIVVDDGIATGATMAAAITSLRSQGAQSVTVASPVASVQAAAILKEQSAELCLLELSEDFSTVSEFYDNFDPVSDGEVMQTLSQFVRRPPNKILTFDS